MAPTEVENLKSASLPVEVVPTIKPVAQFLIKISNHFRLSALRVDKKTFSSRSSMRIKHRVKLILRIGLTGLLMAFGLLGYTQQDRASAYQNQASENPRNAQFKQLKINLDRANEVALPKQGSDLKPIPFQTADGRQGWTINLPGQRPIATPAYWNGMVFVGGGYGSHEFYAFNAQTGAVIWKIKTSDDGPTAAVVEDGCVAFNTESCTVIVCDAKTGKILWQEWLGDPLMSQPAIDRGRLYIAYPAGQRKSHQASSNRSSGHKLLCADLKTGRHIWEQPITADIISA